MINRDYENLQKITNLERGVTIETNPEKRILMCNEIIKIASQYSLKPSDEQPGFITTDRLFEGKRAAALEQKMDDLLII